MKETVKKKTAIYPYHSEVTAVARYLERLNPLYQITRLVMSPNNRNKGKDAGLIYNKPELGRTITTDIIEAVAEFDCLMVMDGTYPERFRECIISNMKLAMQMKKEVICTLHLTEDELRAVSKESQNTNTSFHYKYTDDVDVLPDISKKLYTTKAPVLFVGELVEGTDAFEITLGMTCFLRKKGYNVVSLIDKPWGSLLNMTPFPPGLNWYNQTEDKTSHWDANTRVYVLNRFLEQLERNENPDIIIIQLPGAVMKFNDTLTVGFGIVPYLISLAVQPDGMVLSTFYDRMDPKYYDSLSERFEHQLGVGIDAVHISNAFVDLSDSNMVEKFSLLRVGQMMVDEEVMRLNQTGTIPVYNCCIEEECEKLCKQLVETLEELSIA